MATKTIKQLREVRFFPTGATECVIKPLAKIKAVAYMSHSVYPAATIYVRDAKSPTQNRSFRTVEARTAYMTKWIETQLDREESKVAARKERTAAHTMEVGDVLYSSFGYDQTNVTYYQVVGLKGKATVQLKEIASRQVDDSHVVPSKDAFIKGEKVIEKRVNAKYNSVKISECQSATPVGKDDIGRYAKAYQTPWGCGH